MLGWQISLFILFYGGVNATTVLQRTVRQVGCVCVEFYLCDENNTIITNGAGIFDVRKAGARVRPTCGVTQVCCKEPKQIITSETLTSTTEPERRQCGARNIGSRLTSSNNLNLKIVGNQMTGGNSSFGEFPWMAAVLQVNPQNNVGQFLCGGSVIHQSVILTAAHCIHNINATDLKIRAGEWDTQSISESLPHQDRFVSRVVSHPQFRVENLQNDIALLFLTSPLLFVDNVGTICLPEEGVYINSTDCIATGWGKNAYGQSGQYQSVLKMVELPLVLHSECQDRLRTTRLGRHFILDESFLCAGGIESQDTCEGDGGGPLVCSIMGSTSSYAQVGVISWGVGCGYSIPAVYGSVVRTLPWIKMQLTSSQVGI